MGIEIGKRSIVTQQVALDVTGHNIANANTTGYTRQAANVVTTNPWHTPMMTGNAKVGQLGTGVEVTDIQRYRDSFIDGQIRNETRTQGYWTQMQEGLTQIEGILNEPNEDGLRGVMDNYWKAWQDLSASPESVSARSVVAERAMSMCESFNHAYRQLTELKDDVNSTVKVKVDDINSIAKQIRDLNEQILSIGIAGKQPNDLLDKRDVLVDQLSQLAEIRVYNEPNKMAQSDKSGLLPVYNGMITIQMGGRTLVQGGDVTELALEQDAQGMNMVIWKDTRVKTNVEGGELRGLLDIRGKTGCDQEETPSEYKEIVPTMINNLNKLAETIVQKTNELHRSGFSLNNKTAPNSTFPDGQNFFEIPDAATFDGVSWAKVMDVDDTIKADSSSIAAASNRTWENGNKINFGDGSKALKIAQLKQDLNRREYTVQTNYDLDSTIAPNINPFLSFPSNSIQGIMRIGYLDGSTPKDAYITLEAPSKQYSDLNSLAAAIQTQLDKNTDLINKKITVSVRSDGKRLSFYSTSEKFISVADGNGIPSPAGPKYLLGGVSFSTLTTEVTANPLVQDSTSDDFWREICGNIGVQSQEAQRMVKNQDTLIAELENKRQSLSGVSLDEEMTSMIKFQHAYNAASRFITTMDEQLQTIISSMGLVGR